jgi:beta-lactamase class A
MIDRRMLMTGLPLLAAAAPDRFAALRRAITAVERSAGGPIGISLLDTHTGERFGHRANDRFPLCSTFKLLLAARLLHGADKAQWAMAERLPVTKADMLFNAPFTEKRIGGSASLLELAEAMAVLSDNPAANIALARVGGGAGKGSQNVDGTFAWRRSGASSASWRRVSRSLSSPSGVLGGKNSKLTGAPEWLIG